MESDHFILGIFLLYIFGSLISPLFITERKILGFNDSKFNILPSSMN